VVENTVSYILQIEKPTVFKKTLTQTSTNKIHLEFHVKRAYFSWINNMKTKQIQSDQNETDNCVCKVHKSCKRTRHIRISDSFQSGTGFNPDNCLLFTINTCKINPEP
jgi:hypothetical protein